MDACMPRVHTLKWIEWISSEQRAVSSAMKQHCSSNSGVSTIGHYHIFEQNQPWTVRRVSHMGTGHSIAISYTLTVHVQAMMMAAMPFLLFMIFAFEYWIDLKKA